MVQIKNNGPDLYRLHVVFLNQKTAPSPLIVSKALGMLIASGFKIDAQEIPGTPKQFTKGMEVLGLFDLHRFPP
jgi:hypothetical protein